MADPFSGILEAYYKGELARQGAEMDFLKLQENQRQSRANEQFRRDTLARDDARLAEQIRSNRATEAQRKVEFDAEAPLRAAQLENENLLTDFRQLEIDAKDFSNNQKEIADAAGEYNSLFGSKTPEQIMNDPQLAGQYTGWLNRNAGKFKIFGDNREFQNVVDIGNGTIGLRLRDTANATEGPMTHKAGSAPDENVLFWEQKDVPNLLMAIDAQVNKALGLSRMGSTELAALVNQNTARGNAGKTDVAINSGYNPRAAVMASASSASLPGSGSGGASLGNIDPMNVALSDERDAAFGVIEDNLNSQVGRNITGQNLMTLGRAKGLGQIGQDEVNRVAGGDNLGGDFAQRRKDQNAFALDRIQNAESTMTTRDNNNATRAATARKNAFDARIAADQRFAENYNTADQAVREAAAVWASDIGDESVIEGTAQAFKTILAKAFDGSPDSQLIYGSVVNNPTLMRNLGDNFVQFERARKQINKGKFGLPQEGIVTRAMRSLFAPVQDLITADLPQQHLDVVILATNSGLSAKEFIIDVLLPVHEGSKRTIPPIRYREVNSLIARMQERRTNSGRPRLTEQEVKSVLISNLGKRA